MRRLISQVVVVSALAMGLLLASGGAIASAHPSIPQCSYVLKASRSVYGSNGDKLGQMRIWNYDCQNLAHAEFVASQNYCITVNPLEISNNLTGGENDNTGTLCNSGAVLNTGVITFSAGHMTAAAFINGDIFTLGAQAPQR
jgi:hypothetical protein